MVVVLTIIAVSLAVCYAVMRTQSTMVHVQHNSSARMDARQAAMAGLAIGLRRMHESSWGGVATALSDDLGSRTRYEVTYSIGDPYLLPADADYDELPLRVTVTSRGFARTSGASSHETMHQSRAVVRLIPRMLASEPAPWSDMNQYTIYQTDDEETWLNAPVRLEGPLRFRERVRLGEAYAWSSTHRQRFFSDLEAMRNAGYPDYRPFNGPITLPYIEQDSSSFPLIQNSMQIATIDGSVQEVPAWSFPALASYRMFQGGPAYTIPTCPSTLEDTSLGPNPATNPLGIYYRSGDVRIEDDVVVEGTIAALGKIDLVGPRIQIQPVSLPPLLNSSEPIQLPTLMTSGLLQVRTGARAAIQGLVITWSIFFVEADSQSLPFDLQGRLIFDDLEIHGRQQWYLSGGMWDLHWTTFDLYVSLGLARYFPIYLKNNGLDYIPRVTIRPPAEPVRFHWQYDGQPVYVPHPDDPGLLWEIVRWEDGV